jgi:large subunit ribosomal protein L9
MKIVLREDVETLGRKGDLLDVADGYARNYLVPRGLAIKATKGVVAQAEAMRRNREAREVRDRTAAEDLAGRLTAGGALVVSARAGEGGKLFGSVTSTDIVAALLERTGVEIDRRAVQLDDSIRELGGTEVPIRLHADVTVALQVEVVAQEA